MRLCQCSREVPKSDRTGHCCNWCARGWGHTVWCQRRTLGDPTASSKGITPKNEPNDYSVEYENEFWDQHYQLINQIIRDEMSNGVSPKSQV